MLLLKLNVVCVVIKEYNLEVPTKVSGESEIGFTAALLSLFTFLVISICMLVCRSGYKRHKCICSILYMYLRFWDCFLYSILLTILKLLVL